MFGPDETTACCSLDNQLSRSTARDSSDIRVGFGESALGVDDRRSNDHTT